MSEGALELLNRAIDQGRRLDVADLRLVRRDLFRLEGKSRGYATLEANRNRWRFRAISEARRRVRIAKEKNRLKELNRRLMNKAYSFVTDAEGIRISYRALEADSDMIRMELEEKIAELNAAIHRLPEPPVAYGDGPDERVSWMLAENKANKALKICVEQNLRAAQHAETEVKRLQKDVIIWCKHSQVAWGEVTRLREMYMLALGLNCLHLPDYNEAAWSVEGQYLWPQFKSYAEYRKHFEEKTAKER